MNLENYNKIRNGGTGFFKAKRGLIEVSGGEAIQFLDGLITNDAKTLENGNEMRAAFPNAKGRMLALAGIRKTDDKFLFETEDATHQKLFENLFRFTYAGDFQVDDLSENYQCYQFFGGVEDIQFSESLVISENYFVPVEETEKFENDLIEKGFVGISDEIYEVIRIENGVPKYGIDMDEETVVPEIGFENLISYNKGCYIGQEVIARIHFRGKVAKELKGLIFEDKNPAIKPKDEIKTVEDKNAGFITSVTFSPKLEKTIALAFVRNKFLEEGTQLNVGGFKAEVKDIPFL
jgi:folate-binding protein YgfZ